MSSGEKSDGSHLQLIGQSGCKKEREKLTQFYSASSFIHSIEKENKL